jgi:hypothetical protein
MQRHKVLFEHFGENATTAKSPVAEWVDDNSVDLEQEIAVCRGPDDNGLTKVKRYAVVEVTLPDWLPVDEWIRYSVEWSFCWGVGVDPTWDERLQRWLVSITAEDAYSVAKLFSANLRSTFRKSLRDQIRAWVDDPDRQYDSPLSRKQWAALTKFDARNARSATTTLYYQHRYQTVTGA